MSHIRPIREVAKTLGIRPEHLIPHGEDKAKVRLAAREASERQPGKLVLVTAVTPTDAGEGKTTTSIGLAQGLAKIGKSVAVALREPSFGPIFGKKGGATGGGKATVEPQVEINMHFTGDFHAISAANNLLAAVLDNHLYHGNRLGIDPRRVLWRRVLDLNDRALRQTIIGLGGPTQGTPRETGFDITPASEIMAVLCLSENADDLRQRLARILVALTHDRQPVIADDLDVVGALTVVLRDALLPNLVQTVDGVPAFIHGGPFANIAHGCNSVAATKMAMAHADWTVTEAGFGGDLGMEKFFHIKCRGAGLEPSAVVVVATVKALKRHGGVKKRDLGTPNPEAVSRGLENLEKHLENVGHFHKTPVVALNRFATDSDDEVAVVREACKNLGTAFAVADGFSLGGDGMTDLAEQVVAQAEASSKPLNFLYDLEDSIVTKMEKIATNIYGAKSVAWNSAAISQRKLVERLGYGNLPLCVAKTPMSLSATARKVGRPRDFEITVSDLVLSAGAGFVVPLLGSVMRMPGLPAVPQAAGMDLVDGKVVGLN
jgi:formate--tetrahydrofolate ligase